MEVNIMLSRNISALNICGTKITAINPNMIEINNVSTNILRSNAYKFPSDQFTYHGCSTC